MQGFNCRRWGERGLNFWAVSDIGGDELAEFVDKFEAAMKANGEGEPAARPLQARCFSTVTGLTVLLSAARQIAAIIAKLPELLRKE